ncbi:HEPACAM family member 2 [Anabarilius grahami]|uniref:HEPACAM family member 2 n=1 Tax=Anabarilius grahami TaxID=495550 RepID=A0A3N0YRP9_ANAGA|nr:HEPACAM family member 2 [Anabarilius grahami]
MGDSMLLRVETRFDVQDVTFQGTWCKTKPVYTHLVSFTKTTVISNLRLKNIRLILPNGSLNFEHLDEDTQGEYELEINIIFPGSSSIVKITKTVTVTVSVPVSIPIISKTPDSEIVEDRDNVTLTCSVEHGTNVQFKWLKSNMLVGPSERHTFSQDGPYNLAVNSDQGLKTGGVFTVNPGELVFFECIADSNPPNTCVWISKTKNSTEVLMTGPRFEVKPYELPQGKEFLCRAFNNVTKKQDETKFTLVVASLSTGHEDAAEDFGIYEFVSVPGKMESTQASCRSLARLDSVKDLHTTIYDGLKSPQESVVDMSPVESFRSPSQEELRELREQPTDPLAEQEIIDSIEEVYFSSDSFDMVQYELEITAVNLHADFLQPFSSEDAPVEVLTSVDDLDVSKLPPDLNLLELEEYRDKLKREQAAVTFCMISLLLLHYN